jgi:hypothetical protein
MALFRNSAVPLVIAGLAAASSPVVAGNLDAVAVSKLFPGQFEAKFKGYRVYFSGSRNGKLRGEAYGRQDHGHWYAKAGKLCVSWNDWTDGKAICGAIAQQNGWYVATSADGDVLKFRRTDVAMQ